jgi:hypothetical protein
MENYFFHRTMHEIRRKNAIFQLDIFADIFTGVFISLYLCTRVQMEKSGPAAVQPPVLRMGRTRVCAIDDGLHFGEFPDWKADGLCRSAGAA